MALALAYASAFDTLPFVINVNDIEGFSSYYLYNLNIGVVIEVVFRRKFEVTSLTNVR